MLVPIGSVFAVPSNLRIALPSLAPQIKRELGIKDALDVVQIIDLNQLSVTFRIVNGFRRWEAARELGLQKVPVNVVEMEIHNRE